MTRSPFRPKGLCLIALGLSAALSLPLAAAAQQPTGAFVQGDTLVVHGQITLPNSCWSVVATHAGAPDGTAQFDNAQPVTVQLHKTGDMCAQALVEHPFRIELPNQTGAPFVIMYRTYPNMDRPDQAMVLEK